MGAIKQTFFDQHLIRSKDERLSVVVFNDIHSGSLQVT